MDKTVRILHLEDDATDAELVQIALESAETPCEIYHAKNGKEFNDLIKKGEIDLILADYHLPGYNGITALKSARKLHPEIPFIFVSGTIGEDAAIDCLTQGAIDYIPKVKLSRLSPAVKRAMNEAENLRERKRAEEAFLESGERFRAVADSAVEGIVLCDSQGKVIYWNKAAGTIFGYSNEEILGRPISVLMPKKVQQQDFHRSVLPNIISMRKQTGRIIESLGQRKTGEEFPIELSVASWETHEGTFFTAMIRDITERKQAEESLHLQSAALEAAANAIVITNCDGIITWANPAFTQLTGYSLEEAIGKNPRILKSGEHDNAFYKDLWDTIISGRVWHNELINRRADGSHYTEEMIIAPVLQEDGKIGHFVAIKQDVSERKQHEAEREAIISVASAMRGATTRDDVLMTFLNQIVGVFNADGSMLVMRGSADSGALFMMGYGPVGERFTGLQLPYGKGISNRVLAEGKPYLNNDTVNDAAFFRSDLLGDSKATACIPLIAQEEVIGALWMVRKKAITDNDVNLLMAIANLAASAIHRVTLHEQTERQLQQMASLHQVDIAISSVFDLEVILNILLENVIEQLGVDAASVLLMTPQTMILKYAAGIGFHTKNIEKSDVQIGKGRAGIAAAERRIIISTDPDHSQEPPNQILLFKEEKFIAHHVAPLIVKGQIKGVLEVFCRQKMVPTSQWVDFFGSFATQAAIAVDNTTLFNDLQRSNTELIAAYDATIEGWSYAMDMRDKETEGHTERVVEMAVRFANVMGMDANEITNIRRGALLHDIGKMGVPDYILLKPEKLNASEWDIMRKHPTYAYEMLATVTYLKNAIDIPYCHHEKWDGSGYPRGLKEEHIPFPARIFSIVDVWDALTTDRPYRKAWTKKKALQYIMEQSGKDFDPGLVKVFIREIKTITGYST